MSTLVAQQRLCASCWNPVKGKAVYCSAACRQRACRARPEKPVYPRQITSFVRLNFCTKHQREFREITQPGAGLGSVFAGVVQLWIGECADCEAERLAQIEATKPRPVNPEMQADDDMIRAQQSKRGIESLGHATWWA